MQIDDFEVSDLCRHEAEGMGIILGIIEMARHARPPAGKSVDDALNEFADMATTAAKNHYGDKWESFLEMVRIHVESQLN